jgi:hypothetical protein
MSKLYFKNSTTTVLFARKLLQKSPPRVSYNRQNATSHNYLSYAFISLCWMQC